MGNTYSLSTPFAGSAGIDIPELSDLVHERTIGNARFMKTIRARHRDGVALAKVTVKPYSDGSLKEYGDKILGEISTFLPGAMMLMNSYGLANNPTKRNETSYVVSRTP